MHKNDRAERIELAEEQIEIARREVERGRVVVSTRVEERDEVVEIALQQQDVTIERVQRGVPIETVPAVREEDEVLSRCSKHPGAGSAQIRASGH
jgi:stress response protein YsnF